MTGKLSDRNQEVLQAIVQHYIVTAEPVGSRTLEKTFNLGISSATIRNVMADLEELGLIEQPHTSAGRIPTDKGYRYYVDYLMMIQRLTVDEKECIQDEYQAKINELDRVLRGTSKILSLLSKQTGVVIAPNIVDSRCQNLQLIRLTSKKILMVTVTYAGLVKNNIIYIDKDLSQEILNDFSREINKKIIGVSLGEAKKIIAKELQRKKREFLAMSELARKMISEISLPLEERQLFLDGSTNIIDNPEFHYADKIKKIFTTLYEKKTLIDIMNNCLTDSGNGVNVVIGEENPYETMKNCSLVTAIYKIDDKPMGALGIIGPTRMPYDKMVSIVDFTAKFINNLLRKMP